MTRGFEVNAGLEGWDELADEFHGGGILIGNGSSRAVWEHFGYASLYEQARVNVDHPLSAIDDDLFHGMDTRNFETVLSALRTALMVCTALGLNEEPIKRRYDSIRVALMEAVQGVHVPWTDVPQETLMAIRSEMRRYSWVYSTNYDLLLYWAVMAPQNPWPFKDFFWGECEVDGPWVCFHSDDTEPEAGTSKILYLHGALHLCEVPWGETAKLTSGSASLLQQFGVPDEDEQYPFVPLLITEGNWQDKMAAIRRSDYLSFAYERFSHHVGPLVVFGQSLGDEDAHIVQALQRWENDQLIAASVLPGVEDRVIERKLETMRKLPRARMRFFDATTHPLGSPEMRVA